MGSDHPGTTGTRRRPAGRAARPTANRPCPLPKTVNLPPKARSLARRLVTLSAHLTGTVTHVATREPLAALTFDDGPDPEVTPRLADLLEEHGARGTFFQVGKAAARHPEVVARLTGGGHAVANHSWDHPSFPLLRGRWRRTQLRWCQEALGPAAVRLFRPPYGHQSPASQLDAALLGFRVVAWSAMAEDWGGDPPEVLADRVRRRLGPGAIALFHDALYTTVEARFRDRAPTLEAVRMLLEENEGRLRFVTVPELLRAGSPRKWHWYKRPDLDWLHRVE